MTNHSCRHLKTGFIKSEACHVLKIHDASIHSHETLESRLAPSKYTCRRDLPLMPIQSLNERTTARVASISARRSCQDCIRSCTNATATNSDLKSLQFDVSLHMFESEYILKASGLPLAGKHVSIQDAKSISSSCQHQLPKNCTALQCQHQIQNSCAQVAILGSVLLHQILIGPSLWHDNCHEPGP